MANINSTFSGKSLQYYIIPLPENTNINTTKVENTLKTLKDQLPKNSIIFVEMKDYYQMYIVDNNGNCKPVNYVK